MNKLYCLSTLLLGALLCAACAAEPETIIETVAVESTVEVPVTVEVTRQTEVMVEATQLVEATRLVTEEVTRIVERVVTATPLPTETPEPTVEAARPAPVATQPASAAAQPAADVPAALMQAMNETDEAWGRVEGDLFAVVLDRGHSIICSNLVRDYDTVVNAPTFDVSAQPAEVQLAYQQYRAAIDAFATETDVAQLVEDCRTKHVGEERTVVDWTAAGNLNRQVVEVHRILYGAMETLRQFLGL